MHAWKFFEIGHKMLKQLELWFLKSAEGEEFSFPCQMSSEENKFSFFSLSPCCFESYIGRQITVFDIIQSLFITIWIVVFFFHAFYTHSSQFLHYILFFLLDKHREKIVQIYICIKDSWNLLSRLTHRSSLND